MPFGYSRSEYGIVNERSPSRKCGRCQYGRTDLFMLVHALMPVMTVRMRRLPIEVTVPLRYCQHDGEYNPGHCPERAIRLCQQGSESPDVGVQEAPKPHPAVAGSYKVSSPNCGE